MPLASSGVPTTTPVDGLLRTSDAQAQVTAVAWPAKDSGYVADSGHRLVQFTVDLSALASSTSSGSSGAALSLVVDGVASPLPTSSSAGPAATTGASTEPSTYLASVPNTTHDVLVSLSSSGFTQRFSLWTLTRVGSAPAVAISGR